VDFGESTVSADVMCIWQRRWQRAVTQDAEVTIAMAISCGTIGTLEDDGRRSPLYKMHRVGLVHSKALFIPP